VNLVLFGGFDARSPLAVASEQGRGSAGALLSGSKTPTDHTDDLVDLDSRLWPRERSLLRAGGSECRALLSPELIAGSPGRNDWFLLKSELVSGRTVAGRTPRAVVARFTKD
jgi:hypothetical protein